MDWLAHRIFDGFFLSLLRFIQSKMLFVRDREREEGQIRVTIKKETVPVGSQVGDNPQTCIRGIDV